MTKTIQASVHLARWDTAYGDSMFELVIKDQASKIVLAKLALKPADIALAASGLMVDDVPCQVFVHDERLGSKLIVENKEVVVPDMGSEIQAYNNYLEEHCSEPGKRLVWRPQSASAKRYSRLEQGKVILQYSLHSYEVPEVDLPVVSG